MNSKVSRSFVFVIFLTAGAAAQQPAPVPLTPPSAPAEVAATREDILRLFAAMHVQEQIRATMQAMMEQQRRMIGEMMRKRNRRIADEDVEKAADSAQEFMKNFPLDDMVEDMIPVYQKHLTKPDVDAMEAFYSSPTGQKLVREQAGMASESMQAVSLRVRKALEQAMQRAEQQAKDEEEKEKSAPAATPEQRKN